MKSKAFLWLWVGPTRARLDFPRKMPQNSHTECLFHNIPGGFPSSSSLIPIHSASSDVGHVRACPTWEAAQLQKMEAAQSGAGGALLLPGISKTREPPGLGLERGAQLGSAGTCWSMPTASSPSYMMFTQPSLEESTNRDIRAWKRDTRGWLLDPTNPGFLSFLCFLTLIPWRTFLT